MKEEKLLLIDSHAILHRAYHAFPKTLTNRRGQLVNAVYGFTRMFFKVIEDLKPRYVVAAFDRPEPNFRHKEFVGYQVQRPKTDQELKDQIDLVKEVLDVFNVPRFEKIGFEADDIIGTLAFQARSRAKGTRPRLRLDEVGKGHRVKGRIRQKPQALSPKLRTIIVTGDKDIFQLINDSTFVYAPVSGFTKAEMFDSEKVNKSLGVWPDQIVDYKALMGDSSDNYPGVPGVGPKTASELLQSFKSLEEVYKNLDKIRESVRKRLEEGKESALLSQKLARIITNVPIKLNLEKCLLSDYDQKEALVFIKELGFRSLVDKLPGVRRKQGEGEKAKTNEQMRLV